MYYCKRLDGNKKILEKDVLHDNNLQHPDMGINIAGFCYLSRRRGKRKKSS